MPDRTRYQRRHDRARHPCTGTRKHRIITTAVMWAELTFSIAAAALLCVWLYGIRIYGALARLSNARHHPLFNTGHPKIIALTIDDVPWRFRPSIGSSVFSLGTCIGAIGDVLKQHGCSATLMVIGSYLDDADAETIETLRALCENGTVEYANHGYTNTEHARLSKKELAAELFMTECAVQRRLQRQQGTDDADADADATRMVPFYRPGHGKFHSDMLDCAAARGYSVVLGDIYSFDAHLPVPILHLVHIMITVRAGGIIILHDRPWTPALLRWLLPLLKWRGYQVEMLSRALVHTKVQ